MSVPSLGTNSRPSFSSPFGLQGQPSRAHLPSLRAGHCIGLKGAPGPGSLERLPCPGPQISPSRASSHYLASPIPLLLPPFVAGGTLRAPTWVSWMETGQQTTQKGLRLQSFPLLNPQSVGRLPAHHQPWGPSPWQRRQHLELPGGPGCSL